MNWELSAVGFFGEDRIYAEVKGSTVTILGPGGRSGRRPATAEEARRILADPALGRAGQEADIRL